MGKRIVFIGIVVFIVIISFGVVRADDKADIMKVIEKYRNGWLNMDIELLKELWDKDYKGVTYIPTDLKDPIIGWEGIKNYHDESKKVFDKIKDLTLKNIHINVLNDFAYVVCNFHFEAIFKKGENLLSSDGIITFILRKKNNRWLFIYYHESVPQT